VSAVVPVADPFRITGDPALPFAGAATSPIEAEHVIRTAMRRNERREAGEGVEHDFSSEAFAGATLLQIKVLRHKPGRRCLIEYQFAKRNGPVVAVLAKMRAKGLDKKTVASVRELRRQGFHEGAPDKICIPPLLGVVPEWGLWLQAKVQGAPVTEALLRGDDVNLARRLAEAAFKLHSCDVEPPRTHPMAEEMAILHQRLGATAEARPEWSGRIRGLLADCDRVAASLAAAEARPIHRDFHPAQALVDGGRLWVLDLDLFSAGEPAIDVGNFIAHIAELSLRTFGDAARCAAAERAMEEAYVARAGEAVRSRVLALAALSLARHVWISTLFEDRRPFTERILALSEERLRALPAAH
jgi:hypothetical protein